MGAAGADVNRKNAHGFTPVYVAALYNHPLLIQRLVVSYGADLQASDLGGLTALHVAAEKGHEDSVSMLLQCKADATLRDSIGYMPIDWARLKDNVACIRILL
jgi:ankyrin repeat protein